ACGDASGSTAAGVTATPRADGGFEVVVTVPAPRLDGEGGYARPTPSAGSYCLAGLMNHCCVAPCLKGRCRGRSPDAGLSPVSAYSPLATLRRVNVWGRTGSLFSMIHRCDVVSSNGAIFRVAPDASDL